jgi:hypothetical protein
MTAAFDALVLSKVARLSGGGFGLPNRSIENRNKCLVPLAGIELVYKHLKDNHNFYGQFTLLTVLLALLLFFGEALRCSMCGSQ